MLTRQMLRHLTISPVALARSSSFLLTPLSQPPPPYALHVLIAFRAAIITLTRYYSRISFHPATLAPPSPPSPLCHFTRQFSPPSLTSQESSSPPCVYFPCIRHLARTPPPHRTLIPPQKAEFLRVAFLARGGRGCRRHLPLLTTLPPTRLTGGEGAPAKVSLDETPQNLSTTNAK